jgi:hypothetical protein
LRGTQKRADLLNQVLFKALSLQATELFKVLNYTSFCETLEASLEEHSKTRWSTEAGIIL